MKMSLLEQHLEEIKELAKTCNYTEISEKIGCSEAGIRQVCKKNGIHGVNKTRHMASRSLYKSDEFVSFAKEHTTKEIAEHFLLPVGCVCSAVQRYKIPHKKTLRKYTKDVRELTYKIVKEYLPEYGVANLSEVLGLSIYAVQNIAAKVKQRGEQ